MNKGRVLRATSNLAGTPPPWAYIKVWQSLAPEENTFSVKATRWVSTVERKLGKNVSDVFQGPFTAPEHLKSSLFFYQL